MKRDNIIQLLKPTPSMKEAALDYRQEHFDAGEYVINGSELFDRIPDYDEWQAKVAANSHIDTVDPSWVLTDTFFAVRADDHRIIGIIDLRYQLNDFLKNLGHCRYSVRPSERNKGYATAMLRQVCLLAKAHGLSELKLSAVRDNAASIRTIEHNGGVYSGSFFFEGEEAYIYTVKL